MIFPRYYRLTLGNSWRKDLPHVELFGVSQTCFRSLLGHQGSSQLAGMHDYVSRSLDQDIFPESNSVSE